MTSRPGERLPVADAWFAVDEVEPGVFRFTEPHCVEPIRANGYLVKGADRDLLIDTGMGIGDLRAALRGLLDKRVTVVATHAHVDHIGGHAAFHDCEILVHPREAEMLQHPDVPAGLGFDHFDVAHRRSLEAAGFDVDTLVVTALPVPGYDPSSYRCEGLEPTGLVDEGDTIDLGSRRLEVLHMPGHSPGGIGLWDAASGSLFSGDTLFDGPLLDEIPGADIPSFVATMRRLRALPARKVHGGHGKSSGRGPMLEIVDRYLALRGATAA